MQEIFHEDVKMQHYVQVKLVRQLKIDSEAFLLQVALPIKLKQKVS